MLKFFKFITIFVFSGLVFAENKKCPQINELHVSDTLISNTQGYPKDDGVFSNLLVVPFGKVRETIPQAQLLCDEVSALNSVFPSFATTNFYLRIWPYNDNSGSENDWGMWLFNFPSFVRHELFHKAIRSHLESISKIVVNKIASTCTLCSKLNSDTSISLSQWFFESLADSYTYTFKDYSDFIRQPVTNVFLTRENASWGSGAAESNRFYQKNKLSQFRLIEPRAKPTKPEAHSISRILHSFLLDFGVRTGRKDIFNIWFNFVINKLSDEKSYLVVLYPSKQDNDSNFIFPDLSKVFQLFEAELSADQKVIFKNLRAQYNMTYENLMNTTFELLDINSNLKRSENDIKLVDPIKDINLN